MTGTHRSCQWQVDTTFTNHFLYLSIIHTRLYTFLSSCFRHIFQFYCIAGIDLLVSKLSLQAWLTTTLPSHSLYYPLTIISTYNTYIPVLLFLGNLYRYFIIFQSFFIRSFVNFLTRAQTIILCLNEFNLYNNRNSLAI